MMFKKVIHLGDHAGLRLLERYERHILPKHGFQCAAGRVYGDLSCASVVKKIIQQKGLLGGLPEIHAQLLRCKHAAAQLSKVSEQEGLSAEQCAIFCCMMPFSF